MAIPFQSIQKNPKWNMGYAETATYISCPTIIPIDDTFPQNTEGDQILSASITTRNAASKVLVIVSVTGAGSGGGTWFSWAAFRDSVANALEAAVNRPGGELTTLTKAFEDTPGSVGTFTYKVRAGSNTGTGYVNGSAGGRIYGGAVKSSIILVELLP